MADFTFTELLPLGPDATPYRRLDIDGVSTVEALGHTFLQVEPHVLTELAAQAMHDIAHYLRPGHLAQLAKILDDPEGVVATVQPPTKVEEPEVEEEELEGEEGVEGEAEGEEGAPEAEGETEGDGGEEPAES